MNFPLITVFVIVFVSCLYVLVCACVSMYVQLWLKGKGSNTQLPSHRPLMLWPPILLAVETKSLQLLWRNKNGGRSRFGSYRKRYTYVLEDKGGLKCNWFSKKKKGESVKGTSWYVSKQSWSISASYGLKPMHYKAINVLKIIEREWAQGK